MVYPCWPQLFQPPSIYHGHLQQDHHCPGPAGRCRRRRGRVPGYVGSCLSHAHHVSHHLRLALAPPPLDGRLPSQHYRLGYSVPLGCCPWYPSTHCPHGTRLPGHHMMIVCVRACVCVCVRMQRTCEVMPRRTSLASLLVRAGAACCVTLRAPRCPCRAAACPALLCWC